MIVSRTRLFLLAIGFLGALSAVGWMVGCNGSTTNTSGGTVTTNLSDPPVCATSTSPMGTFTNVWVTVTKVTANINGSAGPSDSGWQTLVDLTANPKQIDLFNTVSTTCVLTQLGSTRGLPPGDYQQIRLYLLANNASSGPSPNNCGTGNGFNCVVDLAGTQELLLSSEAQTGLKIPSGQIAGGKFTIANGQATDLNIDFNACASIVAEGNGQFRLKPVLHAGEVSLNNNAISGKVTDASGNAIAGAEVLLETSATINGTTVDNPGPATMTGSDGTFIFCPLTGGPYDVVVAGQVSTTVAGITTTTTYNPTVVFGVPVGTALSGITLVAEGGVAPGPATLKGLVTTDANKIPLNLYAFESATPSGGSAIEVTIPVFAINVTSNNSSPTMLPFSQPPQVVTVAASGSNNCGTGSNCFGYFLQVPASGPQVYTFASGSLGTPVPPSSTVSATYNFTATASDCTNAPAPSFVSGVAVTPGATASVTTVAFTGCTTPM